MTADVVPTRRIPRLDSLTGLRWIAALMVFTTHAAFQPGLLPPGDASAVFMSVVKVGGYIGVGFFFVLSGFVLTWSAREDDTPRRFWRRRFFKIYPNHFVAFLLAVGFLLLTGGKIVGWVQQLLLVHAWWPDLDVAFGVNDVSWSLSVEALFYLSFPLLIVLVRKIRPERLWWWAGGIMAAVVLMPVVAKLLPAEPRVWWDATPEYEYWFVYLFPPVRALDFVLGMVMARIVMVGSWPRVRSVWAALAFVAGYAAASFLPTTFSMVAATIVPLAFLIPAAAAADIEGRPSWLASRPMVWLGDISYAFYLVHQVALYSMYRLYGTEFQPTLAQSIGLWAVGLGGTVVLAWGMHRLVELPMQRRFSTPRKRTTPDAPRLTPS
ncbi:acyltransferase [Nocardia sp. CDC159]|uniref:Acyltransferase n=1 Tax=Nocardia pulmonis TaxID=2951408 RepID=A0A9X2IVJ0_9NOCA|nr:MULTISPECIES: acyltransferase [Nocardia]MCM6771850.1 acyltransferase [Nocardia pulmonis]MCM6785492.1 acyltransferase [Nocardia sp. CDC159]